MTPPFADGVEPATLASGDSFERALSVAASLGGVTFAVSPTLVMLNTRHAMAEPEQLPTALMLAVGGYCTFFVVIIICAGNAPPPFIFDLMVPEGVKNRVTAFLLFSHVAVSYAISSVALCSAMNHFFGSFLPRVGPRIRCAQRPGLSPKCEKRKNSFTEKYEN